MPHLPLHIRELHLGRAQLRGRVRKVINVCRPRGGGGGGGGGGNGNARIMRRSKEGISHRRAAGAGKHIKTVKDCMNSFTGSICRQLVCEDSAAKAYAPGRAGGRARGRCNFCPTRGGDGRPLCTPRTVEQFGAPCTALSLSTPYPRSACAPPENSPGPARGQPDPHTHPCSAQSAPGRGPPPLPRCAGGSAAYRPHSPPSGPPRPARPQSQSRQ